MELSWAWFARLLLPKMALGEFRGHFWLVLGAPDGLLRVVLASVTPISTIKTALPSFDIIFSLVVVAVVVVSLLPGNFSSTRLGGMRGAIESARLLVLLLVRLPRLLLILLLLLHLLLLLTLLPHVLTKAGDGGVHAARRPG